MKDQTAKADAGKPRVSLVPSAIVRCIAYFLCELLPMEVQKEKPHDDSCQFCEYEKKLEIEYPCCSCKNAHQNYFKPKEVE